MKLLLIDAGNARLKWAISNAGKILEAQSIDYDDGPAAAVAALATQIVDHVDAVVVSNVAGEEFAAALNDAVNDSLSNRPELILWYARSTATAGGVHNAYAQPEQLGVDRWAALIGAYARLRDSGRARPLCVVDAGTALTIDAVESDGRHLGGLILPGLDLQRSALLDSTADLARKARGGASEPDRSNIFSADTGTAIMRSATLASAAAIDRSVAELAALAGEPMLLLTGGDAVEIAPWLATDCEICPNLVFEGLAVLFEQRRTD